MNSWVFITQQPKSPQEALEGVVLINQTKAWRVRAGWEEAMGERVAKTIQVQVANVAELKEIPLSENSVYLLTYPLPASSWQHEPRPNPSSPAGDGGRLGRAR